MQANSVDSPFMHDDSGFFGTMSDDEERPRKAPTHEIGQDLSTLSVGEIEERVALLRNEIMRLETAKAAKVAAQGAASAFFRS